MLVNIDSSDPRPIYVQIVDEVRRGIVLGRFEADAALPSVRQMAAELRLNPNTVAQAYRELERRGVVYTRRGQGTFIAQSAVESADEERRSLAESVARRALEEARRNGVDRDALVKAIQLIGDYEDAGA